MVLFVEKSELGAIASRRDRMQQAGATVDMVSQTKQRVSHPRFYQKRDSESGFTRFSPPTIDTVLWYAYCTMLTRKNSLL